MRFYSELTYWNTACCKKRKNAFVSLSLRWKELQNKNKHIKGQRNNLRDSIFKHII